MTYFDPKKRNVMNKGIWLTSFDKKNVTSRIGGSNWPPLIQKTWRHQQGDLTDLLLSKQRVVTNRGIQLTSFDWKKHYRYQQGDPTDLLDV